MQSLSKSTVNHRDLWMPRKIVKLTLSEKNRNRLILSWCDFFSFVVLIPNVWRITCSWVLEILFNHLYFLISCLFQSVKFARCVYMIHLVIIFLSKLNSINGIYPNTLYTAILEAWGFVHLPKISTLYGKIRIAIMFDSKFRVSQTNVTRIKLHSTLLFMKEYTENSVPVFHPPQQMRF